MSCLYLGQFQADGWGFGGSCGLALRCLRYLAEWGQTQCCCEFQARITPDVFREKYLPIELFTLPAGRGFRQFIPLNLYIVASDCPTLRAHYGPRYTMTDSTLDSIVKGAPVGLPARDIAKAVSGTSPIASSPSKAGDPLIHTPSSPSMIYLNLLILEASLRAQFLELRARRRHHTFFLSILTLWTVGFGYALFLAPREDGSGVGGSVYWVVETVERVCFLGAS